MIMKSIFPSLASVGTSCALLTAMAFCGSAEASTVTFHFTDDKNSTTNYASAASLVLEDLSIGPLGGGVYFTLHATFTDAIFGAGSKISRLAFNGPNGTFDNLAAATYAAYQGDLLVDAMTYAAGDGASVSGIKFNWSGADPSFPSLGSSAFTDGKTSTWFVGGATVADFLRAEYQNPFALLHVDALAGGASVWLLDGTPAVVPSVPEPRSVALLLLGLPALAWSQRRRQLNRCV